MGNRASPKWIIHGPQRQRKNDGGLYGPLESREPFARIALINAPLPACNSQASVSHAVMDINKMLAQNAGRARDPRTVIVNLQH
jgi:hypothetical protein